MTVKGKPREEGPNGTAERPTGPKLPRPKARVGWVRLPPPFDLGCGPQPAENLLNL